MTPTRPPADTTASLPSTRPGSGSGRLTARLRPVEASPAWAALAEVAIEPNPFFCPAFLLPYARHMMRDRLILATVEEAPDDHGGQDAARDIAADGGTAGGRWLIAAPVGLQTAGLLLRSPALWASDYGPVGTPLVHPDCTPEAAALFLQTAAGLGPWPGARLLDLPFLATGGPVMSLLRAATSGWSGQSMAGQAERAAHAGGIEGARQHDEVMSGKRRKEFDRLSRRLAELGTVTEERLRGAAACDAFPEFLALEAAGWKGEGRTALGSTPDTRAFALAFIAALAGQDALCLEILRLDGHAIAMLVQVEHQGRTHAWKIAYDEGLGRFSPGQRVTLQALRHAAADPRLPLGGDSLAVPDHPMINPLWRGRLAYARLELSDGPLAPLARQALAVDRLCRRLARHIVHRLRRLAAGRQG
ncbi:GNAT family N-acetyltransferase [Pannonibacter tanglangensis]|uniref:GNAT family N-acetyltransferase n=1 Tax=Pannonibacter tanglangensis TaxID=2750084 RepID=A0ABW9ZLP8_9HYPH|nr:GNAT family N-acetyltransferase [Pannonibacter sp. XCT-34]NBN65847.1 GNAT family N-acetyltransferase [Pannonibacter sp. XCT-34]